MSTVQDARSSTRAGVPEPAAPPSATSPGSPGSPATLAGPGSRRSARSAVALAMLLGTFAVLVRIASFPLSNYDTYFHLRFGHEFLTGAWSLRHPGHVSSSGTADWVPTQWLPQVVMAQVEDWFGLPGVAWLSGLQFLALATVLYWACRRRSEPLVAVVLVFMALVACTPGMSMRPQQISYLLVAATTAAWLRARDTGRAPWLLVPVTWLWTTCHGMWPVGIVIGVVAVVGLALDRGLPRGTLLRMAAVPVLSALVSLLTPVGPGLFGAVLQVNSRAKYFYEWGPVDYHEFYAVVLLALLALAAVPLLRRGAKASWLDVGLLGLAALWAVYSLRTVPVAACMAAPLAAGALQGLLGDRPRVPRSEVTLVAAGLAAALLALAVIVPRTADEPHEHSPWMDQTLSALPAGTKVLGDSAQGGFLMWAYPQLDLVAHGYGDVYTDAELERNSAISDLDAGWVEQVRATGAQYAVLAPGSKLAYALRETEGWQVVTGDDETQLLAPPPGWAEGSGGSGDAAP